MAKTPILLIGDSRVVGMAGKGNPVDASVNGVHYFAKVSQGSQWLNDNTSRISTLAKNQNDIVISMGVNDIHNFKAYQKWLGKMVPTWRAQGKNVYFTSVDPVGTAYHYGTTLTSKKMNENIDAFNRQMLDFCQKNGIQYIDTAKHVKDNHLTSKMDKAGLHFINGAAQSIRDFIVNQVDDYVKQNGHPRATQQTQQTRSTSPKQSTPPRVPPQNTETPSQSQYTTKYAFIGDSRTVHELRFSGGKRHISTTTRGEETVVFVEGKQYGNTVYYAQSGDGLQYIIDHRDDIVAKCKNSQHIVIKMGVNDLKAQTMKDPQIVAKAEEYVQELQTLQGKFGRPIYFASVTPLGPETEESIDPKVVNPRISLFNQTVAKLIQNNSNIRFVDVSTNRKYNIGGLHYREKESKAINTYIKKRVSEVAAEYADQDKKANNDIIYRDSDPAQVRVVAQRNFQTNDPNLESVLRQTPNYVSDFLQRKGFLSAKADGKFHTAKELADFYNRTATTEQKQIIQQFAAAQVQYIEQARANKTSIQPAYNTAGDIIAPTQSRSPTMTNNTEKTNEEILRELYNLIKPYNKKTSMAGAEGVLSLEEDPNGNSWAFALGNDAIAASNKIQDQGRKNSFIETVLNSYTKFSWRDGNYIQNLLELAAQHSDPSKVAGLLSSATGLDNSQLISFCNDYKNDDKNSYKFTNLQKALEKEKAKEETVRLDDVPQKNNTQHTRSFVPNPSPTTAQTQTQTPTQQPDPLEGLQTIAQDKNAWLIKVMRNLGVIIEGEDVNNLEDIVRTNYAEWSKSSEAADKQKAFKLASYVKLQSNDINNDMTEAVLNPLQDLAKLINEHSGEDGLPTRAESQSESEFFRDLLEKAVAIQKKQDEEKQAQTPVEPEQDKKEKKKKQKRKKKDNNEQDNKTENPSQPQPETFATKFMNLVEDKVKAGTLTIKHEHIALLGKLAENQEQRNRVTGYEYYKKFTTKNGGALEYYAAVDQMLKNEKHKTAFVKYLRELGIEVSAPEGNDDVKKALNTLNTKDLKTKASVRAFIELNFENEGDTQTPTEENIQTALDDTQGIPTAADIVPYTYPSDSQTPQQAQNTEPTTASAELQTEENNEQTVEAIKETMKNDWGNATNTLDYVANSTPTYFYDFLTKCPVIKPEHQPSAWMNSRQLKEYLKTTEFTESEREAILQYVNTQSAYTRTHWSGIRTREGGKATSPHNQADGVIEQLNANLPKEKPAQEAEPEKPHPINTFATEVATIIGREDPEKYFDFSEYPSLKDKYKIISETYQKHLETLDNNDPRKKQAQQAYENALKKFRDSLSAEEKAQIDAPDAKAEEKKTPEQEQQQPYPHLPQNLINAVTNNPEKMYKYFKRHSKSCKFNAKEVLDENGIPNAAKMLKHLEENYPYFKESRKQKIDVACRKHDLDHYVYPPLEDEETRKQIINYMNDHYGSNITLEPKTDDVAKAKANAAAATTAAAEAYQKLTGSQKSELEQAVEDYRKQGNTAIFYGHATGGEKYDQENTKKAGEKPAQQKEAQAKKQANQGSQEQPVSKKTRNLLQRFFGSNKSR